MTCCVITSIAFMALLLMGVHFFNPHSATRFVKRLLISNMSPTLFFLYFM